MAPGEGAVSTGTLAASIHIRRKQLSLAFIKLVISSNVLEKKLCISERAF